MQLQIGRRDRQISERMANMPSKIVWLSHWWIGEIGFENRQGA
jgi:hypothetical protein